MNVIIHKDINCLEKIIPEWTKLKEEFYEITIFQDINWIRCWWNYKSKQKNITPYIVEIRESNKTIGIIPFYCSLIEFVCFRFRILKPMGSEQSDYLIPILSNSYAPEKQLLLVLEKIYEDKSSWDCMDWGDIPENSFFDSFLNNYFGDSSERKRTEFCPYINLNKDVEEVKHKFDGKFLKDVLIKERKLNRKGELKLNKVVIEQDIEHVMNKFFHFHCERWANTDTPSRFKLVEEREYIMQAAKNLFKSNLLHLSYLSHNNEILAVEFGMSEGNRIDLYLRAFDIKYRNYSVGNVSLYYLILESCKEGYDILDFLRGNESYKHLWGAATKFNVKYVIFNPSIKSSLFKFFYQTYYSKQFKLYNHKFLSKRLFQKSVESK